MNTCELCRHWRRDNIAGGFGRCVITRSTVAAPFGEVDSKAVAMAGRATTAVLMTRADFGCVQFEGLIIAELARMETLLDG